MVLYIKYKDQDTCTLCPRNNCIIGDDSWVLGRRPVHRRHRMLDGTTKDVNSFRVQSPETDFNMLYTAHSIITHYHSWIVTYVGSEPCRFRADATSPRAGLGSKTGKKDKAVQIELLISAKIESERGGWVYQCSVELLPNMTIPPDSCQSANNEIYRPMFAIILRAR